MKRTACALIVALFMCAGALVTIFTAPAAPRLTGSGATDASDLAFRPHAGARLPLAAELVDEYGRSVTLGDYFTKSPVILVLEYLRCTSLCAVTLTNVVEALNGLPLEAGRDYALVTISIDPRDKPADALVAQTKYARMLDRGDPAAGVHFLTMRFPAEVREIADTIGFPFRYDALLDAYIHPAGFVIAGPDGVIGRYVEGVAISSRDLLGALAGAEKNEAQNPLTRLLLLCHVRGVPIGRFTVPVLAVFTVADIAAVFSLVAIFAAIWRRRT